MKGFKHGEEQPLLDPKRNRHEGHSLSMGYSFLQPEHVDSELRLNKAFDILFDAMKRSSIE